MKKLTHLLIMVSLVSFAAVEIVSAYEPSIQWQKTFGGSLGDIGTSVQQTSDGGYIITGVFQLFPSYDYDVYLIKTNSEGNLLWEKTFGISGILEDDYGNSVQQTSDGGYIIAGETYSFGVSQCDVYLIKTDPNGNLLWQKTFGGNGYDYASSVQQTMDGDFIIAGRTNSFSPAGDYDVYLIKTDSEGNLLWEKTVGGNETDEGRSIQQTKDGGYIITGSTTSFGEGLSCVYLIKTDPNGNLFWQKTFGGNYGAAGFSVQQASDDGYIIAGGRTGQLNTDVYLIKTDSAGNSQWEKALGGSNMDIGYSVQQASDDGYIIAGYTTSFGDPNGNVYIIKTDSDGNSVWQKSLGGSKSDSGASIQQTTNGGYIIAGYTDPFGGGLCDVYLIKLSAEVCQYVLFGDINNDCKVDFYDFALMAGNWLIDCNINPADPACVPK